MVETNLIAALTDAKRKVLVSCRPLAPARVAFNLALQAIVDAADSLPYHCSYCREEQSEPLKAQVKELFFKE